MDFRVKKQGSVVLSSEEIDYLLTILNSNIADDEKAKKLYALCTYSTIFSTRAVYRKVRGIDTSKIDKIFKIWEDYDSRGLFEKYKNPYKCSMEEVIQRLKKLIILKEIVFSELSDYQKATRMSELFESGEKFRKSFSLLIKFGANDSRLDFARDELKYVDMIYQKYLEYEKTNMFINIRYLKSLEQEIKVYPYAKFVISSYVNDRNSYKTLTFMDSLGINQDTLEYCSAVVEELDGKLYDRYVERQKENVELRFNRTLNTVKMIIQGIKTGRIGDKPFDALYFLKIVPFKKSPNFLKTLFDFVNNNLRGEGDTLYSFMARNGLYSNALFRKITLNELDKMNITVDGRLITREDNEIVFDYLVAHGYPIIYKTYFYVRDMYLRNLISSEEINSVKNARNSKAKEKVIIIP